MTHDDRVRLQLHDSQRLAVQEQVERAAGADVVGRLWARDDTLWGPAGQPEVADRLGWLDVAERVGSDVPRWEALAADLHGEGVTEVVLLGMGGSSLAPEVLWSAFGAREDRPSLRLLDSTHPRAVTDALAALDPASTAVVASSKSGGTLETRTLLRAFEARGFPPAHVVVVTDPGSGLEGLAADRGYRHVALGDPEIGGRFSALSAFGLVPAALIGADVDGLLADGAAAGAECRTPDPGANPGLLLGCALAGLQRIGRDKLTVVADRPLQAFGLWAEQLVAESTGKAGTGVLPVADEPAGPIPGFGDDRVVLWVHDPAAPDPRNQSFVGALAAAGHPVLELHAAGPAELGGAFVLAEVAVAVLGWALGINAFDQPNVQAAKDAAAAVLEESASGDGTVPASTVPGGHDAAVALVDGLHAPGYLAILAWTALDEDVARAAAEVRAAVRERTGAATTFGFGPRYLHSTGQLHKGGPAGGRFLLLVDDDGTDVVPAGDDATASADDPSFRTIALAQALGDERTLVEHDRAVARLSTGGDPAGALHALAAALRDPS